MDLWVVGVIIVLIWLAAWWYQATHPEPPKSRRGRMLCPACREPLRGQDTITLEGTIFHADCIAFEDLE